MKANKRYAIMIMLFHAQLRRAKDDIVTVLRRKIAALHNNARQRLDQHRLERARNTDDLIGQSRGVLSALIDSDSDAERIANIHKALGGNSPGQLLEACDQHLELLNVQSASSDSSIVETCQFVLEHRRSQAATLPLQWLPEKWRKAVTGKVTVEAKVTEIDRKNLELCLLSQVASELRNGDLFIEHSDEYCDYRNQLITVAEYHEQIDEYSAMVDLPHKSADFVDHVKQSLASTATTVDRQFPKNENVLTELKDEGMEITEALVAGLAPYRVAHINRFGDYSLNPGGSLESMNFRADFLR